jgi:hypothetical protein
MRAGHESTRIAARPGLFGEAGLLFLEEAIGEVGRNENFRAVFFLDPAVYPFHP